MSIVRPQPKQVMSDEATKVFSGVLFDVYQWQQEMFDGTEKTFERLRRPDGVRVIPITDEGNILILSEEQPGGSKFYEAAGGRVDPDEDIESSARRELLEETGYNADELELWFSVQPMSHIDFAIFYFIARGLKESLKPSNDSGEKIEISEVKFDDFINNCISGKITDTHMRLKILESFAKDNSLSEIRDIFGVK